jgi:hypothetical protein
MAEAHHGGRERPAELGDAGRQRIGPGDRPLRGEAGIGAGLSVVEQCLDAVRAVLAALMLSR